MYCDACGASLQDGQAFCGGCGKSVRPGLAIAYPRPSRVREHTRLLGILWLAYSAFHSVGGVVLMIVANTIFGQGRDFSQVHGPAFLHGLLTGLGFLLLVRAAAGFAAGWGLLQRESWARVLTLVVAFMSLFDIPIGTTLGIYTLWVLLPVQSERDYEAQARAA
jgi:hypothetical protein